MDERATQIANRIVLTGFALIVLGSCAVPAIMAYMLDWRYMLAYPAVLALILTAASFTKRK